MASGLPRVKGPRAILVASDALKREPWEITRASRRRLVKEMEDLVRHGDPETKIAAGKVIVAMVAANVKASPQPVRVHDHRHSFSIEHGRVTAENFEEARQAIIARLG